MGRYGKIHRLSWCERGVGFNSIAWRLGDDHPHLNKLRISSIFTEDMLFTRFREEVTKVRKTYREAGWERVGSGRHRSVFLSPCGKMVAKVSRSVSGVQANLYEWLSARDAEDGVTQDTGFHIPEVYTFYTFLHGVNVLLVEAVERIPHERYVPRRGWVTDPGWEEVEASWMEDVDCDDKGRQVGRTANGRVVCFDWCTF